MLLDPALPLLLIVHRGSMTYETELEKMSYSFRFILPRGQTFEMHTNSQIYMMDP